MALSHVTRIQSERSRRSALAASRKASRSARGIRTCTGTESSSDLGRATLPGLLRGETAAAARGLQVHGAVLAVDGGDLLVSLGGLEVVTPRLSRGGGEEGG